jgi:hypothetical protein
VPEILDDLPDVPSVFPYGIGTREEPTNALCIARRVSPQRLAVVHCVIDLRLASWRVTERHRKQPDSPSSRRAALARRKGTSGRAVNGFENVSLAVPTLRVATAKGYDPGLEVIIDFIRA